jgi:dipeptidyl aminopeptidase/acylaminoacyl peptidase
MRALLLLGAAAFAAPAESGPTWPGLRELVEVVDLSGLSASPDGRRVVIRTDRPSIGRNSYELTWHSLDVATGVQRPIASGGDAILADPGLLAVEVPIWSPDSRWIYFRALHGGAVQIWRAAADGSGSATVTQEDGDVLSLEPSPDGLGIDYRVGPPRREIEQAELEQYDQGILVDEHVDPGQNVFRGAIINGRHATQRLTGPWFSRGGLLSSRPLRARRIDFARPDAPAVAEADLPPTAAAPGNADSAALATSSRRDVARSEWDGSEGWLAVIRPDRPRTRLPCPLAECRNERVAWAAWRPGRDQLVFATVDRAIVMTLWLWDLASGQVRTIMRGNGLLNGGRDEGRPCAVTDEQAWCVLAEPNAPPRIEAIDIETGVGRPRFDPNAFLRARRWPSAERLSWRSAEGRQFTGILFLPEPAPSLPLPLFINYYRCEGFVRGGLGDEWPFALLAASGIASVCVNATRMGGQQDGVGQYRAALAGIEELVDLLANRGLADRGRVGMGGLSFGSEVTMWAVANSDLISAASVASPQFAPSTYWFNSVRGRDYPGILRQVWGLGSPEETPDRWRLLSPALHVERIGAPLLLQLSEQEWRYGLEFYARLSNSSTPAELYVFPDEPHIKVQPRHRLAVYRRNLDWFRFWLQGHVDPDPAKADQYRRWRALADRFAVAQADEERSQSSSATRSNTRK